MTYNILFLCTGNSARSIIAEAVVNKEAAGRFPVEVINMVDYGRMNAAGIIDHCVSVMG